MTSGPKEELTMKPCAKIVFRPFLLSSHCALPIITKALKELNTLSVQVQLDLLMLQIILHQAYAHRNEHSKCRRKGIDKINPISLWNRHVRDSSSRRKGGGNVRIVTTLHGKLFRRLELARHMAATFSPKSKLGSSSDPPIYTGLTNTTRENGEDGLRQSMISRRNGATRNAPPSRFTGRDPRQHAI